MVSNPNSGLPSDLLSVVDLPRDRPVTKVDDEQARTLLEETGASGSRRRNTFYVGQHQSWWMYVLRYMGFQTQDVVRLMEDTDPRLLATEGGYVANHILRIVSGNVARKSQAKPSWDVVPNTADQPDQDGAKVAQHLLDYAYDHLQLYRKSLERNLWLETCGTAFYLADWNFSSGGTRRIYIDPMRGVPVDGKSLQPQEREFLDRAGAYKDVTDGDWEVDVLSPFQVILPNHVKSIDQADWVRFDRVFSIDELWNRWPDKAKDVSPDDEWSSDTQSYWRRLTTMSSRLTSLMPGSSISGDGILVSELWMRPSKRCPQGMTIIGTKTNVLENGPNKFFKQGHDERFPIIDYHNIRVPGRFWSMGTVEHLLQPQLEYNRARDQINRQRDILGAPQWLSPKGSLQGPTRNEFGDIWEYDPIHGTPVLVPAPMLAPATVESAGMAVQDMQMIAAQSDPTQGNVPTGVRSGVAIRALQEKDSMVMGPAIADLEKGDERLGSLLLKLAWKNMKLPRAIAIYGEARQADIAWFKGADLNGNTRVSIRSGSMMPKSKAETMELVFNLMQAGALQPAVNPAHQRIVFKAMEIGGADKLFLQEDADRRRARIENNMYSRPPQNDPSFAFPDVDVDDDHAAHLEEHLLFKKTDEFERLPPVRKMHFNAHMEMHKMALSQMLEAQVAMQTAAGAGSKGSEPRQPGKASQPREREATPGSES